MIAIDLDGTLLNSKGELTPRTRAAIAAAIKAGWFICFATGRTWAESKSILDIMQHYDAAVFVGGAAVIDTSNGKVLHRTAMQPLLAAQVCGFFEDRNQIALALQDRSKSDVDYLISDLPMNPATELWMRIGHFTPRAVPDLGTFSHPDTMRVSVAGGPAKMSALLAEINTAFGSRIQSHSVGYHHYEIDVLEVFDPAVDKWQGVVRAAEFHNIRRQQIIAVGDNMNDVSMIRGAGLGVAMGNAKEGAKAAADRIIGSNDENGLAIFIEELLG